MRSIQSIFIATKRQCYLKLKPEEMFINFQSYSKHMDYYHSKPVRFGNLFKIL